MSISTKNIPVWQLFASVGQPGRLMVIGIFAAPQMAAVAREALEHVPGIEVAGDPQKTTLYSALCDVLADAQSSALGLNLMERLTMRIGLDDAQRKALCKEIRTRRGSP